MTSSRRAFVPRDTGGGSAFSALPSTTAWRFLWICAVADSSWEDSSLSGSSLCYCCWCDLSVRRRCWFTTLGREGRCVDEFAGPAFRFDDSFGFCGAVDFLLVGFGGGAFRFGGAAGSSRAGGSSLVWSLSLTEGRVARLERQTLPAPALSSFDSEARGTPSITSARKVSLEGRGRSDPAPP